MKLDKQKYLQSRGVKPTTLLLGMLAVNLLLGLIVYVFPEGGLHFGKIFGLKFVNRSELFKEKDQNIKVVDIDALIRSINIMTDEENERDDSLKKDLKEKLHGCIKASPYYDSIADKITGPLNRRIQYPPKNIEALNYFFEALMNESKAGLIRILHYGDSQLEGDRITDYVRNRLQQIFGGEGPGIVLPLEPAAGGRRSAYVQESGNFKKHAIYKKGSEIENNRYGVGGSAFEITGFSKNLLGYDTLIKERFEESDSSYYLDTIISPIFEQVPQSTAYIAVYNAKSSYQRVKFYSKIQLLYHAEEPFNIRFQADDKSIRQSLPASKGLGIKTWENPTSKKVRIDFAEGKFPMIYGLALDGETGVAVDNFPMRGSSAIGFSRMNKSLYAEQLKKLNVKLIILQYGINVVPIVRSDYSYYKKQLVKQLKAIRTAHPDISILLISPSDMSRNEGGDFVSYKNIPLIRNAMKEAAFETGCAFWDLYEAMGGKNSMSAWVEKGLAQKDYTHLSHRGAKYVGEMLFEALLEQMQEKGFVQD